MSIWKQKGLPTTQVNYLRASGLCFCVVTCHQEDSKQTPKSQTLSGTGNTKSNTALPARSLQSTMALKSIQSPRCFLSKLEWCVSHASTRAREELLSSCFVKFLKHPRQWHSPTSPSRGHYLWDGSFLHWRSAVTAAHLLPLRGKLEVGSACSRNTEIDMTYRRRATWREMMPV